MKNRQKTVYLCKSNKSDPKLVTRVRKYLKALDLRVLEHEQYTMYSLGKLLQSDFVVLVPSEVGIHEMEHIKLSSGTYLSNIYVGKGQYDEVKVAFDKNIPVYSYHTFGSEYQLFVGKVNSFTPHDSNSWKLRYGIIESFYKDNKAFDFELDFLYKDNKPSKFSYNDLLLII